MTDLSDTIEAKSDQLNADDLIGVVKDIIITDVRKVSSPDQPIIINYQNDGGKPLLPCKTVRRILVKGWGADGTKYIGRSLRLYRDEKVKYAGKEVGGIRVSHMSHIDKEFALAVAESRGKKKPVKILPMEASKAEPTPEQKAEAASNKAKAIVAELLGAGDKQAVLDKHANTIGRLKDAYSDLYDEVMLAAQAESVPLDDEDIPL